MMTTLMVLTKINLVEKKGVNRTKLKNYSEGEHNLLQRLYFDGKKDSTLIIEKFNQKHF